LRSQPDAKFRILVVDDEPGIRDVVGTILEEEGYDILRADSVRGALARLEETSVDLVLTDLKMPDEDGLDLVRRVRERYPGVATVIFTGHASVDSAIEGLRLGITDYLKKPFRLEDLKKTVERVLGNRARVESESRWVRDLEDGQRRFEDQEDKMKRSFEHARHRMEKAEERLRLRSSGLHLVDEIHDMGSRAYHLDEFLDRILERICVRMRVQKASIMVAEETESRPVLTVRAARGHRPHAILHRSVPFGTGVAGWVAENRKTLRVERVSQEHRFRWDRRSAFQTDSFLSVPLASDRRVVGVLNLNDKETREPFSSADEDVARIVGTALAGAIENQRLVESIRLHYLGTTRTLVASLEAKDPFIRGHSSRVTATALQIGETLGLSEDDKRILDFGGHLHDIGKLGVPERILHKPGILDEEERRAIAQHPEIGTRLLRRLPFLREVHPIVRHHHERWDGRGYPDGLAGNEIPLLASIVSLADAYDAMTSGRCYRSPMSWCEAREEIRRNCGTQFRPEVVDAFLETGSVGRVGTP
jgi:putative nucleotidyltransferase with HDIG domain